jgi:hypothetical protein
MMFNHVPNPQIEKMNRNKPMNHRSLIYIKRNKVLMNLRLILAIRSMCYSCKGKSMIMCLMVCTFVPVIKLIQ